MVKNKTGEIEVEKGSLAAGNQLFPIFLKLDQLSLLIVGGGYVGFEKLNAILQNSPEANITIVATNISDEIKSLAENHPKILLIERPYESTDVDDVDLVFAAVNDREVSEQVSIDANEKGKLVNAADK